jgi:DNA-binding response OmpR family regulator
MKILLVEDDQRAAEFVKKTLASHNYLLDWVSNGQSALDYAEASHYALLILDIGLSQMNGSQPQINGIQLCQRLRTQGYTQPILMLTAHNSLTDKIEGLDAGADDYLIKPFEPEELLARMRALLRRGFSLATSTTLTWEHLHLNPSSCEVTYDGHLLPLTPKEYSLLELFLRNPGHVFSLESILEYLWPIAESPGEETIRVHIRSLRQKLRNVNAPQTLIETVYGMGYRLGHPPQKATSLHSALHSQQHLWQQGKPETLAQVNRLYQTINQLAKLPDHPLDLKDAHQLSGILGSYGLDRESTLAQQIYAQLQKKAELTPAEYNHLRRQVICLKQLLDPCVVLVDPDITLLNHLQERFADQLFRVITTSRIHQAKKALEQDVPNLLVIDSQMVSQIEDELVSNPCSLILLVSESNEALEGLLRGNPVDFIHKPVHLADCYLRILFHLSKIRDGLKNG